MKIEIDTVKGFQDFLPTESLKREKVKEIIARAFELYGFQPIETPLIEYDELMRSDTLPAEKEDEAISDRFRLKDKAGRNLGLRYEFTFQLSRIFKQNPNLKLPFKRYQIGPVFRDEPISSNRFRQFTQCDADIIGSSEVEADAECLSMISDVLKELKIPAEIEINNRNLLNSIIESVQIPNSAEVIREIDKIDKIGEDEVKANLRKYTSTNQIVTLFKILEKPQNFFKENSFDGFDSIERLTELAKLYGFKVKFNPYLARGLSYYTGNIFEIKAKSSGKLITIASGGRYDKTVGKYLGRDLPAVGVSFGLERVSELTNIDLDSISRAVIISLNQEKEAIALAKDLRDKNIPCTLAFGQPGKQLEYANALSIPYAIFIGEEEVSKKKYKLKNLDSGAEKLLTKAQLIKQLVS